MKTILSLFPIVLFTFVASLAYGSTPAKTSGPYQIQKEKAPKSPRKTATGNISGVDITIDYGSPYVKERQIWGKLVKYNKIWRAGANETTAITFSKPVKVGGKNINAGTYAFFIKPMETGDWTILFNTQWSREEHKAWGAYRYKEKYDVAQFSVTPKMTEKNVESLTYWVTTTGITFAWEKVELEFSVSPQ